MRAWIAAAVAACLLSGGYARAMPVEAVVQRSMPGQIRIVWQDSHPVDIYVAEAPDAPIRSARLIARGSTAGSFELAYQSKLRPFFILQDQHDRRLARVAERSVALQRGSNFRDLGGYEAADGKHVRWGLIYRGAAMPMLSDADYQTLAVLGIRWDIDLRSREEREVSPDVLAGRIGARYFSIDYPANDIFPTGPSVPKASDARAAFLEHLYRTWPTTLAPQFRAIFQDLLQRNGAVAFHCSAGQDRSGIAAALILSALGVKRDTMLADYHLSTQYRDPANEMQPIDPLRYPGNVVALYYAHAQQAGPQAAKPLYDEHGVALLQASLDEIDTRWGSMTAYLHEKLGLDAHDIERLRQAYLE